MGENVLDGPAHALLEADRGLESRHRALELGIVEQDRVRLVADEPAPEVIGADLVQELLGDMDRLQFHA